MGIDTGHSLRNPENGVFPPIPVRHCDGNKQVSTRQRAVNSEFRTIHLTKFSSEWPIWVGIPLQSISCHLSERWPGQDQMHKIGYIVHNKLSMAWSTWENKHIFTLLTEKILGGFGFRFGVLLFFFFLNHFSYQISKKNVAFLCPCHQTWRDV